MNQLRKRYCSSAMIVAIFVGAFFILAGFRPVGKGLILGALFSIINFVLIGELLPLSLGRTRVRASFAAFGSIALRYCLLAAPLIAAIRYESFHIAAVVAGLFMVQVMIVFDHLFGRFLIRFKSHA